MGPTIRIGLVFSHSLAYCRGVLRGIKKYAEAAPQWAFLSVSPEPRSLRELRTLRPDGLIAHVFSARLANALRRLKLPLVNVCGVLPDSPSPRVGVDDGRCGSMAAEHLLERGLRHFAFVGHRDHGYSLRREMGFRDVIEKTGFRVESYYERGQRTFDPMGRLWAQDRAIQKWVAALPKPVGIFAPNDIWGVQLTEVCLRADIAVPEDVAILSVDDDDLLCDFARPPLSSVALPTERIGYEAAAQLDRMMRGAKPPRGPILFPPIRVIARRSTEILAVADVEVRAALLFIRDQAHRPIRVTDILREVPTSRRSLERRFRAVLGRSLLDEIRRVHVERARHLLTQTDLSLDRVAESSGFTDAKRFSTVFREATGMTPRAFRIQFRFGPAELN